MHELSVCRSLLTIATRVAREHGAADIGALHVRVGALSGVEPDLLEHAFLSARRTTPAANATLSIETVPITVRCDTCGGECAARPDCLRCTLCGSEHTRLTGGNELLLTDVVLRTHLEPQAGAFAQSSVEDHA